MNSNDNELYAKGLLAGLTAANNVKEGIDYDWNVISENDFKARLTHIFDIVSSALSKTLGPFGSTSIIEQYGEMCITKDGWQVLKNIKFDDTTNSNILALLTRICIQVNAKVGDGSTSSIVSANSVLHQLEKDKDVFASMRPKEIIDSLNSIVEVIAGGIYSIAKQIDKETMKEIYDIALISTNGDETVSSMIHNIYLQTKNSAIDYSRSRTPETSYEIIDGYKTDIRYLDQIYAMSDDGNCTLTNPYILCFDHKIDIDSSIPHIQNAMKIAQSENRRLVVVSPYYDALLLSQIRGESSMYVKSQRVLPVVYCRLSLINDTSKDMYNDFCILTGGRMFTEDSITTVNPKDESSIAEFLGTVGKMVVNFEDSVISGMDDIILAEGENTMYKAALRDATYKYNEAVESNRKRSIINTNEYALKQRLSKLTCKMGAIKVGGNSSIEAGANYDLVEDAVRACESAYTYGYNVGGNLIIPHVISYATFSEKDREIANVIKNAFLEVYRTVLLNKYGEMTDEAFDAIVSGCRIEPSDGSTCGHDLVCYDLIKEEYSTRIINSCITDVEILKATVSTVALILSSNQYLSLSSQASK